MAFPGSGLETIYRNSIDTVAEFLKARHGEDFLLINLSGKKIAEGKFPTLATDVISSFIILFIWILEY